MLAAPNHVLQDDEYFLSSEPPNEEVCKEENKDVDLYFKIIDEVVEDKQYNPHHNTEEDEEDS